MIHDADFEEATNDVSHDKILSDDGSDMDINNCDFLMQSPMEKISVLNIKMRIRR